MPRNNGYPDLPEKQWFQISNIGQNAATMWLYDEIGGWGITAQGFVQQIAELNVAEIELHISSPGGDVFDGIAIMNALRDHPANVTVKVDALAASIASVIAQAGNKIVMGNNSMMMIHNASGFAMGEGKDLRKMADLLDATTANIADVYAQRAGGKAKEWLAAMDAETWYSAEEAVAAGLADEVAPLPTEREAHQAAARFDLSNYTHAPKIIDVDPEIDPLPDPPVPRETEPIAWDPALFTAAVTDALPQPVSWDPELFTAAVKAVVNDAPAGPPARKPEPVPATGWDPDVFDNAIRKARQ